MPVPPVSYTHLDVYKRQGQMGDQIRTHTGEIGAGFIDIPFRYRDGDVTVLHLSLIHILLFQPGPSFIDFV